MKNSIGSGNEVAAAFKKYDTNNDGKISIQELRNGLKATVLNFTNQEVDVIFAIAGIDGHGEISSAEFQHLLGTGVSLGRRKDEKAAFLGLTRIMMKGYIHQQKRGPPEEHNFVSEASLEAKCCF